MERWLAKGVLTAVSVSSSAKRHIRPCPAMKSVLSSLASGSGSDVIFRKSFSLNTFFPLLKWAR